MKQEKKNKQTREGWKKELLGNLIDINTEIIGRNYAHKEINYFDISSVKSGFVENIETIPLSNAPSRAKRIVKDKDTILSTVRPRNRSFYYFREAKENDIASTGFAVLRPKQNKIDDRYLYYLITDYNFTAFLASNEKGAAYPAVTTDVIERAKINLPPLPTQRRIASILSAYDDLIENNLKRIQLLEEMAQITYEEWFVRMKFPGHETAKFDKETGLPEGWKKVKLGKVCNVSGGGTPSKLVEEYWQNGSITWFSPTDLSKANSCCLLDSSNKITELGLKKSSAKLMQPNSFMMTSRATIGLFGLTDKPFATNQGFINVTPKLTEHKYFLFFNFKYRVPEFLNHATGSTFPELSKSKFKFLKINWPTPNILKEFDCKIDPIIKNIMNLEIQNQGLKEARDILLPRLMTGRIDVDEIQNQIKEII